MKPTYKIYTLIFIVLIFSSCSSQNEVSDDVQSNETYTVNDKAELASIRTVAIFVNGDDKELEKIFHDALNTGLKWEVIDRTRLETAITRDYEMQQNRAQSDSTTIYPLSFDEMSQLVNSNHYVTVDFSVGKKQYVNQINIGNAGFEKIAISSVSFRVYKTGKEQPIAVAVIDYLNGESPTYAAKFVNNLINEMKSRVN